MLASSSQELGACWLLPASGLQSHHVYHWTPFRTPRPPACAAPSPHCNRHPNGARQSTIAWPSIGLLKRSLASRLAACGGLSHGRTSTKIAWRLVGGGTNGTNALQMNSSAGADTGVDAGAGAYSCVGACAGAGATAVTHAAVTGAAGTAPAGMRTAGKRSGASACTAVSGWQACAGAGASPIMNERLIDRLLSICASARTSPLSVSVPASLLGDMDASAAPAAPNS